MVEILLVLIAVTEALVIIYLMQRRHRLKKEYKRLQAKYEESKELLAQLRLDEEKQESQEPVDKFATHDTIIEMFKSGIDAGVIAERLEIPKSKVEMTLKFEKMKKDGAQ
jgi:sortase (surface protein transpeptidase)